MVNVFRFASVIAVPALLTSCITAATTISDTHRLISADPIQTEFAATASNGTTITLSPTAFGEYKKEYLGLVLINSGTKCQAFADRLSTAQRGVDTSFDILSGILSALATALTPLSTVHALTAAATISTGTKSAIAADIYAKATASLILQQINRTYYANIDNYRKDLVKRDADSIVPALEVSRIQAIHRECSLDAAIANLSEASAVTTATLGALSGAVQGASTADDKGLTREAGAIIGAAAGAAGATGGASAASDAAARQGAAAAAGVGSPAALPSAPGAGTLGGGAPAPGATTPGAGQRIKVRPPTTARSNLFRALSLDAHGKIDPARGQLMRECWAELLHPVPTLYFAWLQQASDQTLQEVADCINKKALGIP